MRNVCAFLVFLLAGFGASAQPRQEAPAKPGTKSAQSKVACTDNSKRPSELPAPGLVCEQQEFSKRGRPLMFPAHGGIAWGISSDPAGRPILYLWADNQTEEVQTLYVCCISTVFEHINVYDSEGHRVLSKDEETERKARSEGHVTVTVQVCSCSGWVLLQPHTIKFIEFANISDGYALPPGRYIVAGKKPTSEPDGETEKQNRSPLPPGLSISVP